MTLHITDIASGVYGVSTDVSVAPGVRLPLRMTVLRLDEGLALIAPVPIDDALASELAALGEVRFILAPNLLHHAHIQAAVQRYPDATLLGAPGLAAKKPDLKFDGELGTGSVTPQLKTLLVLGADKLSEVVLVHTPSRTLVVTDLVFNIHGAQGLSKLVLSMMSRALGRVEQSRLCRWLTTDRAAVQKSIEDVLALPFDRVVMAHGDVIEREAKAELTAGLWWMRGQRKRDVVHAH
ncbi:MAG: hypothetical protein JKY37_05035 [Nannocystaceae bacterium]|nr:hypothetical protein [Nannocystaceae bacterium]